MGDRYGQDMIRVDYKMVTKNKDVEINAKLDPVYNRTVLPLRCVGVMLGYDVTYRPKTHTAVITERK